MIDGFCEFRCILMGDSLLRCAWELLFYESRSFWAFLCSKIRLLAGATERCLWANIGNTSWSLIESLTSLLIIGFYGWSSSGSTSSFKGWIATTEGLCPRPRSGRYSTPLLMEGVLCFKLPSWTKLLLAMSYGAIRIFCFGFEMLRRLFCWFNPAKSAPSSVPLETLLPETSRSPYLSLKLFPS